MANNLRIDTKLVADGYHLVGILWPHIDFHAMPHVEHLIHFLPVGARTVVDNAEKRRHSEHIIFHYLAILAHKMQHFGLRTTSTMYHSVYLWAKSVEHFLDNRSIGAGRREYQLPRIYIEAFNLIG